MKVNIGRRVYNTETSTAVGRCTVGTFGDPEGYEEILYRKRTGEYFLLGQGGEASQYADAQVLPLEDDEAEAWAVSVLGEDEAEKVMNKTSSKKR